jgi:tRNA (guanine-N7-)-methyltransferase
MLLRPGDLETPTPPEALFDGDDAGPVFVEIGFGNGRFLCHLADHFPEARILGVELSPTATERSLERLKREGHTGVRLILAPGEFVVRDVMPRASLNRVFVNFPDPWPKERHRENRLLDAEFFTTLADRMADGSRVYLTTDHDGYFDWSLRQADESGLWSVQTDQPPAATLGTKYAKRWQAEDKSIQHAVFTPADEGPEIPAQIQKSETMHHAIIRGRLPDMDAFDKLRRPFDGGQAILLHAYRSVDGERLLLTGLLEEEDLSQDIIVEAYESPTEELQERLVVRIKPFGKPLTTDGTSQAVDMAAEWLTSLDDDYHVIERRY